MENIYLTTNIILNVGEIFNQMLNIILIWCINLCIMILYNWNMMLFYIKDLYNLLVR